MIENKYGISSFCRLLGIYFVLLILGAMNIGAIGSLLKVLALIPVFLWAVERHSFRMNKQVVISIVFFLIIAISYLWSIDQERTAGRIISQFTFLILILAVSGFLYNAEEIQYLKKCLVWSSRLTAVIVIVSSDYYEGRIYLNGIVKEDPNYLCAYFLFGMIFCLSTILGKENLKKKIVVVIETIIYLYIILGTGSRGGVLAVIFAAVVFLMFYKENETSTLANAVKKLLFIFVLSIGLSIALSYLSADILNRFSIQTLTESTGTGRFDMWESAIDAFKNSTFFRQFFGYGTASAIRITYIFPFSHHLVFHNMFIESLLEIGIIGLLVYVGYIGSYVVASVKNKDVYCLAIIMGMVTLSLSVSICVFKPYWNIMLFILVCMNLTADE